MNCSERPIGRSAVMLPAKRLAPAARKLVSCWPFTDNTVPATIASAAADSPAREGGHRCNLDRLPNHSRCFRWSQR